MKVNTRESLLTTYRLHGWLGERFGHEHQLATWSLFEGLNALNDRHPGFRAALAKSAKDGVGFDFVVDGESLTTSTLTQAMWRSGKSPGQVDIVPMPSGSLETVITITILGFQFSFTIGQALIVASLIVSGVSLALSEPPKEPSDELKEDGFAFTGGSNISSPGVPVPLLYGRHLTGSVTLATDVVPNENTETLEKDQYIRQTHMISEGVIQGFIDPAIGSYEVEKVTDLQRLTWFDETPATEFERFDADVREGELDQLPMPKYNLPAAVQPVGLDCKYQEPQVQTLTPTGPASILRLNFSILALSRQTDDGLKANSCSFTITITNDSTGLQVAKRDIGIGALVLGRRVISYEFPITVDQEGPFIVEVVKTNGDQSEKRTSLLKWDSAVIVQETNLSYPGSALVGAQFNASNFTRVPRTNFLAWGIKVQVPDNYDPVAKTYGAPWNGLFAADRQWSDNNAWVLYDFMTAEYGMDLDPADIDVWSFYRAAVRCDELTNDGAGGTDHRYRYNRYIFQQEDALNIARDMAASMECKFYWNGTQIALMQDRPSTPVHEFVPENVVEGTFSYVDTPVRSKVNRVVMEWNDPDDLYRTKLERRDNRDGIAKYGVKQLQRKAHGATVRHQVIRRQLNILENEKLQDSIKFNTGLEGAGIFPGDVFRVADPYRDQSMWSGRLKHHTSQTITADQDFEDVLDFPATDYTLELYRPDVVHTVSLDPAVDIYVLPEDPHDDDHRRVQVWYDSTGDGTPDTQRETSSYNPITKELTLVDNFESSGPAVAFEFIITPPIETRAVASVSGKRVGFVTPLPSTWGGGTVFSLYETNNTSTRTYRCVVRSQLEGNTYEIGGVPYDDTKYARVDGLVDVRDPDTADLPPWLQGVVPPPPVGFTHSFELRRVHGEALPYIIVRWGEPDLSIPGANSIDGYQLQWQYENSEAVRSPIIRGNSYEIPVKAFGTYVIKLASVQLFTGRSSSLQVLTVNIGQDDVPDAGIKVTGLGIAGRLDSNWVGRDLVLEWDIAYENAPDLDEEDMRANPESVGLDSLFETYMVQVQDANTGLNIKGPRRIGKSPTWRYTLAQNEDEAEGGSPRRELRIGVAAQDTFGRIGDYKWVTVRNLAPALPTLVSSTQGNGNIFLELDSDRRDPDFDGFIVWMRKQSASFAPTDADVAFKGRVDRWIRLPVEETGDYVLYYAAYDKFSDQYDDLNVSTLLSFTITGVDINPQEIVDSAVIGTAQIDELSANKITGGTLDVDVIAAQTIRAEKVAFGSRDNVIWNPNFNEGNLDGYYKDVSAGGGSWNYETTLQLNGTGCARYDWSGSETGSAEIGFNTANPLSNNGMVATREGDEWYFDFQYRTLGGAGNIVPAMRFYNSSGTPIQTFLPSSEFSPTTSWTRAFMTATAPANSYYVVFFARMNSGGAASSYGYVDAAYARRLIGTGQLEEASVNNWWSGYLDIPSTPVANVGDTFLQSIPFVSEGVGDVVVHFEGYGTAARRENSGTGDHSVAGYLGLHIGPAPYDENEFFPIGTWVVGMSEGTTYLQSGSGDYRVRWLRTSDMYVISAADMPAGTYNFHVVHTGFNGNTSTPTASLSGALTITEFKR